MGLFSQCFDCETWNDRYRKQPSPRTGYLPGYIKKSHFVYSPNLLARKDCVPRVRPSIQQVANTFAVENLKIEKPIGLPQSSYYLGLEFPQILIKPHPDSLEPRTGLLDLGTGSPEPRTGLLDLGTGIPEAINLKVIHVKPALDLWEKDESTELTDDDNDELDLETLIPSEVGVNPKETKLINVKPAKESIYHVQETDADLNDIQLTTDSSQVVDCDAGEVEEEHLGKSGGLLDDRINNNVSSDIASITLQESSLKPQPKPGPKTMFCVTRDKAWKGLKTSNKKKKSKKDKVTYTNIETLVQSEDEDEDIKQKKKSKNIFQRLSSRFAKYFR